MTHSKAAQERLETPVLFLIFNQPAITMQTFEEIRKARPRRLFISADGPRPGKPGEAEECAETRRAVLGSIDWECEVTTRLLENNLGCKAAVSSAITWFLDKTGEGIILEYDCVPSQSFFTFCAGLLEKYRHDERVMAISGSNYQQGNARGEAAYYFSRIPAAWGWATWKRAWSHWDGALSGYPAFRANRRIETLFHSRAARNYWTLKFDQVHGGIDKTWGHPWVFAVFAQHGVCATANRNLVTNIGFTANATNAVDTDSPFANTPRHEIGDLSHPDCLVPDLGADDFFSRRLAYVKPAQRLVQGAKRAVLAVLPPRYHESLKRLYRGMRKAT